jgi:preprotein translocase subunit SecD
MRSRIALLAVGLLVVCSCSREKPVTLEFRVAETEPGEGLTEMTLFGTDEVFYLHDHVLMSNSDVDTAYVTEFRKEIAVEVLFTDPGRISFARITRENMGKRIGIIVDGKLVTAPVVRAQVRQGKAVINGNFTEEEAQRIARGIILEGPGSS